jgi:hypothetical protein
MVEDRETCKLRKSRIFLIQIMANNRQKIQIV